MHFFAPVRAGVGADADYPRPMRLLPVVCAIVFADTVLFGAMIPLIPAYADELDLSKLEAGLLVGAYGAGALVAGIPSGYLAARLGPKRTVVVGLVVLALASAAFALAEAALLLGATRFAQGVASASTWAGALAWLTLGTPRERRGRLLGTAFGFAVLGFIVGPAVGALAEQTSVRGTFLAVAACVAGLAFVAASLPAGPPETLSRGALTRATRDARFVVAVWLTLIPALFFGALDVLVPLELDEAGWNSVAIAVTFAIAGLAEVALAPTAGALSDRYGRMRPMRLALWGLVVVSLALAASLSTIALLGAALVVCASIVTGFIYTPSIALVSDRAEANGVPQTLGFGVMNVSWAFGAMAGPAGAGALADGVGGSAPFVVVAALALGTAALLAQPRWVAEPA